MAIRAYDPCLSCATHKLDGSIAVKVEIRDSKGKVIDTIANW
jgi:F420-non-reducing hydrogenase large subunit